MNLLVNLLYFFISSSVWEDLYLNPRDKVLEFNILLKQRNIDKLENTLIDRSNPHSNNYGKWLEKSEIDTIIAPFNYYPVIYWLKENNIDYLNYTDNLRCKASVYNIHKLFNTSFTKNNSTTFSIPKYVSPYIDIILGMSKNYTSDVFGPIRHNQTVENAGISPESLKILYNISFPNHNKYSSQAVVEFLNDSCYSNSSLQDFMNNSSMPDIEITKNHFWGSCDPNTEDPDMEATLDIQYQTGVNNNTHLYYISAKDWLYQFSNLVYRSSNPPKVLSMSYGWAEWDQCDPDVFPTCLVYKSAEQYSKRTNIEFMKLGLRGITLVASSGDAGAPGRTNEGCDGDNKLNPSFPASSPWVLAVGGTIIMNATTIKDPHTSLCKTFPCIGGGTELNCNRDRCGWTAGGGFSGFFNRPPWQINASDNYLNSSVEFPPHKFFNKNGRIYPDLSLVSHNYFINTPSGYTTIDGTSASAPSVSGMISILNNLRVSNKKSTLGPVGALLYTMQNECETCFKDITVGSNNSTE